MTSKAFDLLKSALMNIAVKASMECAYQQNWSADFARSEVAEIWENSRDLIDGKRDVTGSDILSLTSDQQHDLGFRMWDDDGPILIPLYAFHYIADGEELTSISGERLVKGSDDIDLDVRCGCIAYGFALKQAVP